MENFRSVKILLAAAAASAVLLLLCSPGALAYNNMNAHPSINGYAYETFVNVYMPYDQYLKTASLDGGKVWGEAWDLEDGGNWHDRMDPVKREKAIWEWIKDAGFSADEPEMDMALIHFYDPVRTPHYLTDTVNDVFGEKAYVNPETDAYQWAFTYSGNPYSFEIGKAYYKDALAGIYPDSLNYGKAWRSVGETMHLISDMTIPAHVRNDGHIPYAWLWDPLEYFTGSSHVDGYSFYDPSTSLGNFHSAYSGETDIRTLFKNEALWTNTKFFSGDTVPRYGKTTMGNGEALYPSPTVTWSPSFEGYITATVDGRTLKMARQSLTGIIWKEPYLVVDQTVCDDQRSILIPTAIKSSTAVLDAFLPRFKVVLDSVKPDPEDPDYYLVKAHIEHIVTREWPNDLTIRNGAFISIDDIDTPVYIDDNWASDDNLNKIEVSIEAKTGDNVQVYYNLGGYQVCSVKYKIPEVSPTPTPTATEEPHDYNPSTSWPWLNFNYVQQIVSRSGNGEILHDFWYSKDTGGDDTYDVWYHDNTNLVVSVHHLYDHGGIYEEWIKEYDPDGNLFSHQYVGPDGWHYVVGTPAPVGTNPGYYD
ncbi:MAG TPA: hypothetical protein VGJ92_09335 [Methanocella sp.]|jgi:hypothetical protein